MPPEHPDHPAGDRRREQRVARRDHTDRPHQLGGHVALQQEPARPCLQRLGHVAIDLERRHDDDPRRGQLRVGRHGPQHADPVETGHLQIEQENVGTGRAHHVECARTVVRLTDEVEIVLAVDEDAQAHPHELVVVGERDPDHGAPPWGMVAVTS
jgi:hypothetical protein